MQMPPGSAMPSSKAGGDVDAVTEDVVSLDQ
jgi:hypothetical protein